MVKMHHNRRTIRIRLKKLDAIMRTCKNTQSFPKIELALQLTAFANLLIAAKIKAFPSWWRTCKTIGTAFLKTLVQLTRGNF
jgi:hypothetical protein